jgi:hypothetical protein
LIGEAGPFVIPAAIDGRKHTEAGRELEQFIKFGKVSGLTLVRAGHDPGLQVMSTLR